MNASVSNLDVSNPAVAIEVEQKIAEATRTLNTKIALLALNTFIVFGIMVTALVKQRPLLAFVAIPFLITFRIASLAASAAVRKRRELTHSRPTHPPIVTPPSTPLAPDNVLSSPSTTRSFTSNELFAEKTIGTTKIQLLRGDLLREQVDAIVNAANGQLAAGGGICGAIYHRAGATPFQECKEILAKRNITHIPTGDAVMTLSGKLAPTIRSVIHAVGPVYSATADELMQAAQLQNAYTSSLELITAPNEHPEKLSSSTLRESGRSIAFPSISTGYFFYPIQEAAALAMQAVKHFIQNHPMALDEVRFVFLNDAGGKKTAAAYQKALEAL